MNSKFGHRLRSLQLGDHAIALADLMSLADKDAARTQYNLGIICTRGRGVTQDDKAAPE